MKCKSPTFNTQVVVLPVDDNKNFIVAWSQSEVGVMLLNKTA